MLRNTNDFENFSIQATDGNIGHVKDFYFDDRTWVIRYFVVDTGNWLSSRKVLISPIGIGRPDWKEKILPASITIEQVKNSPEIDIEKPVSRQHEMQFLGYYNYPYYWGGVGLWGAETYPSLMSTGSGGFVTPPLILQPEPEEIIDGDMALAEEHRFVDPDLRSCKAVIDYHIGASDGDIGHVTGFLVDEDSWAIRYLIVDTSNWWLGHQVLIAPQWIDNVRWSDTTVSVNLTRQAIQDAPPYDSTVGLDRRQELDIYQHYGRAGYWAREGEHKEVRAD